MKNPFTEHSLNSTSPQGYWEHGLFAGKNSLTLIYAGVVGVIHAFFPWWFKFTTSTAVIKSFKLLLLSGRHTAEFDREGVWGSVDASSKNK